MTYSQALVIDDDDVTRNALRRALLSFGLHRVVVAGTLAIAKGAIEEDADLVIAAPLVARESCVPLLESVAQQPNPPVILVIGGDPPRSLVFKLGQIGAVRAYLEKPIANRTLWQCLSAIEASSPAEARVPDQERTAKRADAIEHAIAHYRLERELTNAEAETLRYAMLGLRRPQIAIERGVSINTLKTQVRSLLNKCTATSLESLTYRVRADLLRERPRGSRELRRAASAA